VCVCIIHTVYDLLLVLRLSYFSNVYSYFSVDLILLSTCTLLARKIWNYVMYKIFLWNCAVGIKAIFATRHSKCFSPLSTGLSPAGKLSVHLQHEGGMAKNSEIFSSSEWHWNFFFFFLSLQRIWAMPGVFKTGELLIFEATARWFFFLDDQVGQKL